MINFQSIRNALFMMLLLLGSFEASAQQQFFGAETKVAQSLDQSRAWIEVGGVQLLLFPARHEMHALCTLLAKKAEQKVNAVEFDIFADPLPLAGRQLRLELISSCGLTNTINTDGVAIVSKNTIKLANPTYITVFDVNEYTVREATIIAFGPDLKYLETQIFNIGLGTPATRAAQKRCLNRIGDSANGRRGARVTIATRLGIYVAPRDPQGSSQLVRLDASRIAENACQD